MEKIEVKTETTANPNAAERREGKKRPGKLLKRGQTLFLVAMLAVPRAPLLGFLVFVPL